MPLLVDPARLKRAVRACMRTCSSPGADGVTWRAYRSGLDRRLGELAARLRAGDWAPGPLRQVAWDTPEKRMEVVIPNVEDRIVQRALRTCAEPILEATAYPSWLYGWRPGSTRVAAVAHAACFMEQGAEWVADMDVAAATGGASTEQALGWLARWISDGTFLSVVRRVLDGLPSPLAPGSGLTPLLTNLRLVPIDEQLEGSRVVRVTDNYAVFCESRWGARAAFACVQRALAEVGLALSAAKSKVWRPNPEDLFLAG